MKNIFITGASKGIGKAAAIHFLKERWFVGVTDIDKEINYRNCELFLHHQKEG